MEFLVTDGETFAHEEKRDLDSEFEYIHAETLGVRYVNRDPRRPLYADQGDHLRPAPLGAADAGAAGGRRGAGGPAEGVCAAGAASGWRGRGQLGARGGRGRLQDAGGVEGSVVAGHGRELRILARELRVCGRERRLARRNAGLPDGLGVRIGDQRQYRAAGRAEPGLRAQLRQGGRRAGVHGGGGHWRHAAYGAAEDDERAGRCHTNSTGRGSSSSGSGQPIPSGLGQKSQDGGQADAGQP